MLHLWQLRSYLATFQRLSSSQQERKQTINHCSSFEALSSPAFRPSSRLSTTQEIVSARSLSDLLQWGQTPALHLQNGILHADKGPLVKRTGSSVDTVKRKKEKKKTQKKELLNEVVKSTGFPKTHSSLLFRAGVKRTRMPLKEQMMWNFYYVYLHSLLHIK